MSVTPVLAHAQTTGEPSLSEKETARELFRDGDEKFRAGDYEGALKSFVAADDLMRLPTTGIERGRTLLKLGKLLEASEVLQRVTRIPRAPDEIDVQQQARDEAQRLIDEVRDRIPSMQVVIIGVPEQTAVMMTVDGVEVPKSAQGFPQKVNPGKHVIRVTAPGFKPHERTVDLTDASTKQIEIEMEASAGSGTPLDPWSEGADEGAGSGVNGYDVLMWSGFAVAAIGLGVGSVTGVMTLSTVADLEEDPRCDGAICDPSVQAELDEADTVALVSTVAFVLGGVGLAAGVAGLIGGLYDTDPSAEASVRPLLGPGFVGVDGRF
jgi:hypothetical protein